MRTEDLQQLPRETLEGMLVDFAKNWLAHDGVWFQAVESKFGMEAAMEADRRSWKKFSRVEAKRIMARHGIEENGGLAALKKALGYRLYAFLNDQVITEETGSSFVFKMVTCRVQSARERKNMPPFPCKVVGIAEYSEFASAIDPRIKTECIACPPDVGQRDFYCGWRFSI